MNVERLHAITLVLKEDYDKARVPKIMGQIVSHLQNVVNQPQQPNHQEQLANSRKTLRDSLEQSKANQFSPAWHQVTIELGINSIIGTSLVDQIDTIFNDNQITPQVALNEINELLTSVQRLSSSLQELNTSFSNFGIGYEVLEPGEGEVGILLPRTYLDNRFDNLAKELKELNSILTVLGEVGTGEAENFEIRSLSTTDPFFILGATLGALSTISIAVKPIISAYKEILEVRLLHSKLAEANVSAERLQGIEEHAEEIMSKAIEEIKAELLQRYPGQDEGRKNELSNALGPVLKKIAARIDRGFSIEVRVEPLGEETDDENTDESNEKIQLIIDSMKDLEYIKLEGEPILQLPDIDDAE